MIFGSFIIDFTLYNDLLKCFTIQRLILFSDIIYKNMASARVSNPRPPSKIKPLIAATNPTKDQSASDLKVSGHQIRGRSSSTDPTPKSGTSKDKPKKIVSYILENNIR